MIICFQHYMFCLVLCEIHLSFHYFYYFASLIKINVFIFLFRELLLFPAFEFLTWLFTTFADSYSWWFISSCGAFQGWGCLCESFMPSCERVPSEQLCTCFCQSSMAHKDPGGLVNDYLFVVPQLCRYCKFMLVASLRFWFLTGLFFSPIQSSRQRTNFFASFPD